MKLKKINATLGLISIVTMLVHIGYVDYAYLAFYYNPTLKRLTSLPFMIVTCLHAVCGMAAVFLQSDGTRMDLYPKQNLKTVIQRLTAALILRRAVCQRLLSGRRQKPVKIKGHCRDIRGAFRQELFKIPVLHGGYARWGFRRLPRWPG